MSIIERNIDSIKEICGQYRVANLFVFGSILTDRFSDLSDVDMLVSFNSLPLEDYADNFLQLQSALEQALDRSVDLVEDKAIRNPVFRANVDRTKVCIYG